jgi:hypothetical protein
MDLPMHMAEALDNLCEFERTIEELRLWGQPEQVIDILIGAQQDIELVKKLEKTRLDSHLMQQLDHLWRDEKPEVIQNIKCLIVERMQETMWNSLREVGTKMSERKDELRKPLGDYAFICIRQVREAGCHQRSNWERLYIEVEKLRKAHEIDYWPLHPQKEVQLEWKGWMKTHTTLSEEDAWADLDDDQDDDSEKNTDDDSDENTDEDSVHD